MNVGFSALQKLSVAVERAATIESEVEGYAHYNSPNKQQK
jgi:hypothetical protein